MQPDRGVGITRALNIDDGTLPASEKVLRPKLFNYPALGKPVLARAAGFASGFVREETAGAVVFVPEVEDAVRAFDRRKLVGYARRLSLRSTRRPDCKRQGRRGSGTVRRRMRRLSKRPGFPT